MPYRNPEPGIKCHLLTHNSGRGGFQLQRHHGHVFTSHTCIATKSTAKGNLVRHTGGGMDPSA